MADRITWPEMVIIIVVSCIVLALLSFSRFHRFNIAVHAIVLSAMLLYVKYGTAISEQFFFEASPYRKCQFNGFHGRPLQFDYSLTEPEVQCNPF